MKRRKGSRIADKGTEDLVVGYSLLSKIVDEPIFSYTKRSNVEGMFNITSIML